MFPDPVDSPSLPRDTPASTPVSASARQSESSKKKATPRVPVASMPVFATKPLHEFRGHEADVLDLSWSKVRPRSWFETGLS